MVSIIRTSMLLEIWVVLILVASLIRSSFGFRTCFPSSGLPQSPTVACRVHKEALLTEYDGMLEDDTFRTRYQDTLPEWILEKAHDCGYVHPTRIQQRVLDSILREQASDLVVHAQTGRYVLSYISMMAYL